MRKGEENFGPLSPCGVNALYPSLRCWLFEHVWAPVGTQFGPGRWCSRCLRVEVEDAELACTCRKGARCAYCMDRDKLTTADYAFKDASLALDELGHHDVTERLRRRWPEVRTDPGEATSG